MTLVKKVPLPWSSRGIAVTQNIWITVCLQISFAMFGVYVLTGNELTAAKALVTLSLINVIKYPFTALPGIIASFIQVGSLFSH